MFKFLVLTCISASNAFAFNVSPQLMNGTVVPSGDMQEVVILKVNGAQCNAAIVGMRTLITAAHCAKTGETGTFDFNGVSYSAEFTRHSLYPTKGIDFSLGLTAKDIINAQPLSIGGKATIGLEVELYGTGATDETGAGLDGILRQGTSVISGFSNNDMVLNQVDGAAFIFGDSGAPVTVLKNGLPFVLGVASKGNMTDTSYAARLDTRVSRKFIAEFIKKNSVKICGINAKCP